MCSGLLSSVGLRLVYIGLLSHRRCRFTSHKKHLLCCLFAMYARKRPVLGLIPYALPGITGLCIGITYWLFRLQLVTELLMKENREYCWGHSTTIYFTDYVCYENTRLDNQTSMPYCNTCNGSTNKHVIVAVYICYRFCFWFQ